MKCDFCDVETWGSCTEVSAADGKAAAERGFTPIDVGIASPEARILLEFHFLTRERLAARWRDGLEARGHGFSVCGACASAMGAPSPAAAGSSTDEGETADCWFCRKAKGTEETNLRLRLSGKGEVLDGWVVRCGRCRRRQDSFASVSRSYFVAVLAACVIGALWISKSSSLPFGFRDPPLRFLNIAILFLPAFVLLNLVGLWALGLWVKASGTRRVSAVKRMEKALKAGGWTLRVQETGYV